MDLLGDFLTDRCVLEPEATVSTGDLYASYTDWAQQAGEKPMSQKALGGHLTERGFDKGRTKQERQWRGIRLRGSLEPEQVTDVTDRRAGDPCSGEFSTNARDGEDYRNQRHRLSPASPAAQEDPPEWVTGATE
jgi:phage/plasmid-associated DNA primase